MVKLYNAYAKIGVGNAVIPFAELGYSSLRSKKYSIGTHINYRRLNELNKIKDSDWSELGVSLFGQRFWKKHTLSAGMGFEKEDYNYYGFHQTYPKDFFINPPDLAQSLNRFDVDVKLLSTKKDSFNLRYQGELDYKLTQAKEDLQEHYVTANVQLSQFVGAELYKVDVIADINDHPVNTSSILGLKPSISTLGENFKILAGLGAYLNAGSDNDFHFYPLAELKYNALEDVLVPYAGLSGGIQRNNFRAFSNVNLFVREGIPLINTNQKYEVYGGIRGTLSQSSSFNLSATHQNLENAYFFVKSYPISGFTDYQFSVVYDDLKELKLQAEYAYRSDEKLKVFLKAQYFNYSTKNETEAWHRPELIVNLNGIYSLRQKLNVSLDLFFWGEQSARSFEQDPNALPGINMEKVEKLDAFVDANLGFEYRYTKKLAAFIRFNNIAGVSYKKYQDYPTQGFNVLGGFSYSF